MREATRADTPTLNTKQAQCPICWSMFSSDSTAEAHKPYKKPETKECKSPQELGMEATERKDGVAVWSIPMAPEVRERMERMWSARRKES